MKKVLTARDVEKLLQSGGLEALPGDAIITPSGRDAISEFKQGRRITVTPVRPSSGGSTATKKLEPIVPDLEFKWKPGSDPKTPEAIARFFASPAIEALKARMCDIGRRIWEKEYVDGNGGNITVRVGDNLVLCTPTLISKGFMTPEEMCLIDLDGTQLAGTRKRTSEAMTHLGIMKRQPQAKSCVHAHPPHATAFAVAAVRPPSCMIPEAEVFLGRIGYAAYQTPGTPENATAVGEIGVEHQCIIMENHGVICWGKDVEDAYWKMENVDSYCKTIWIASQLGNGLHTFGSDKLKDLIAIRQKLGMPDARSEWKECELCDNSEFRPGVVCQVPAGSDNAETNSTADTEVEGVVRQVTDAILQQLSGK